MPACHELAIEKHDCARLLVLARMSLKAGLLAARVQLL